MVGGLFNYWFMAVEYCSSLLDVGEMDDIGIIGYFGLIPWVILEVGLCVWLKEGKGG